MKTCVEVFSASGTLAKLADVARVSFGKNPCKIDSTRNENDYKLVETCFRLRHLSVFEFANIAFWVHCPIFVARQLMRYRCASYIERSLRRCEPLPVESALETEVIDDYYDASLTAYRDLQEAGVKKEQARCVLTLASPTEFLMQVSLRELFHIFDERLDKTAQAETRGCVEQMFEKFTEYFPEISRIYKGEKP